MFALFLLEAAKRTGREFSVTQQSQIHTVRDTSKDVRKVAQNLMEKNVTIELPDRLTPKFVHPTEKRWEKLKNSKWLAGILSTPWLKRKKQRG